MPTQQKILLGQLLIEKGLLYERDLLLALKMQQQQSHRRLGEILVGLNHITEAQLSDALVDLERANGLPPKTLTNPPARPARMQLFGGGLAGRLIFVGLGALFLAVIVYIAYPQLSAFYSSAEVETHSAVGSNTPAAVEHASKVTDPPQQRPEADQSAEVVGPGDNSAGIIPSDAISIGSIRSSGSFREMRIVFEANRSLANSVNRENLNGNEVVFRFTNSYLVNSVDTLIIDKFYWLKESRFEQNESTLEWYFTTRQAGQIKYHELKPDAESDQFRFIVILQDD